jgi:hypothetical protein
MKRVLAILLFTAAALASPSFAEPLARRASLAVADRVALETAVASARKRDPAVFRAAARILDEAAARDADRRGPFAILGPELEALGPDGVWALADALLARPADARTTETAQLAVAVGVIDAAGARRDRRLAPLWLAILDGGEARPEVLRSAAGALARLDDDMAAAALVERASSPAVQAAMGACRRRAVADYLVARLAANPAPDEARRLIGALAELGAAWAWETPSLRERPERATLQRIAVTALRRAWTTGDSEVRAAAKKALRVVGSAPPR